ncbi:4-hydroxybenzoate octaprenyltransferase [Flavisphingomonas formosensis]|uniref:4-hydroxybenzoate octaprenyltransferase n=1 Tax=Flavisphingomonas formosensis TaxID=861534 RepID=UPI0012FAC60F|nr:4-hydroxybenzoate octaprenyltransferase [Sphingomonas formosensis]
MAEPVIVPDSEQRGIVASLPPGLRDLVQLARFDRPIGAWLLYWPGAWAIALAGAATRSWPLFLWFALGAVAMRGAGCVYNDIVDRDLDRKVERTRSRPLASGRVSLKAAWGWLVALCLVGLMVLVNLGSLVAAIVALFSLVLVAAYPFMKRITWWPQAWLGLVFSWAAPVGWCAARSADFAVLPWLDVAWPGLCLYAGSIFWVIGYDTIYALQDIEDDALAGVKSSARALGRHARSGIAACYAAALAGWSLAIWSVRPDPLALAALLPIAAHLVWQVLALHVADASDALAKFRSNRFAGLLLFLACLSVGMAG